MPDELDLIEVASALLTSVGLLRRRVRQTKVDGDLTLPETAALARLDRNGPATSSALAKLEEITPQSMGVTLAGLEARGLIERRNDLADGRRILLTITAAGQEILRTRRSARAQQVGEALSSGFTSRELAQLRAAAPLIERLAHKL